MTRTCSLTPASPRWACSARRTQVSARSPPSCQHTGSRGRVRRTDPTGPLPGQPAADERPRSSDLLSTSGVTRVVDRMERDGLVAGRPAPATGAARSRCSPRRACNRLDETLPGHLRIIEHWFTGQLDPPPESLLDGLRRVRDAVHPGATAAVVTRPPDGGARQVHRLLIRRSQVPRFQPPAAELSVVGPAAEGDVSGRKSGRTDRTNGDRSPNATGGTFAVSLVSGHRGRNGGCRRGR